MSALATNSPQWLKYVAFVLAHEGRTSKDPHDSAAHCAPFAGAFHTNKGVTYCTFRTYAAQMGITPVTYSKFITLTDEEVGRFIYRYYESVNGPKFSPALAIAMTEAAWGSGPDDAFKHLSNALRLLGKDIAIYSHYVPQMETLAKALDQAKLFLAYEQYRWAYVVDYLGNLPQNATFKHGWANRINDFRLKFAPPAGSIGAVVSILIAMLFH